MMKLTETKRILGTVYAGNRTFYAVGLETNLVNFDGLDNLPPDISHGWWCVDTLPKFFGKDVGFSTDPFAVIYDVPVLVIGGAFVWEKHLPFTIEVLKRFSWDEEDVNDLDKIDDGIVVSPI